MIAAAAILATGSATYPRAPMPLKPYPQLVATRYTKQDGLPAGPITDVRATGMNLVAFGGTKWKKLMGNRWVDLQAADPTPVSLAYPLARPGFEPKVLSAAQTRSREMIYVTTEGPFRVRAGKAAPLDLPRIYKPHQPVPHIDSVIKAVTADSAGNVWIATDHGLYATDGGDWWHPMNRDDGMPYEDMLSVAVAPNGDIWGGTTEGAWRLRKGEWRYFHGPRWMPGNRVNQIAVGKDGAVWLATDGGVAKIEERMIRLDEKAAHYEELTAARHNRRGYVTRCRLKTAGDPSGGFVYEASDNDGLWTAMYVGAEAFRYAATKSPEAHTLAKKSMDALLDLVRLSGVPGYPARAIIRKGETVDGYDPEESVRIDGETDKIWFQSKVDPNLLCKGDTSSDELDGHYFAWYVYHDLVADDAEKHVIRDVVRAVTDNILTHGYTLVGHTGRKTRWGVWGPQYLNDDPRWWDERGLNSSELLCYLKVAHHICGDKRFLDAYNDLIDNHHYLLNTMNYRRNAEWWSANHSDDELAFLVYYPLLMLERDSHRLNIHVQTATSAWQQIRPERSPFYNFLVGGSIGVDCDVIESVRTLEDWPWELIDWPLRNSHRHDVRIRVAQSGRSKMEIDRVLPMSERGAWRWNSDPYEPDQGGNGMGEEDGAAFLLPYWMGRYHGIITDQAKP